jgi:hypothetical protein
VDDPVLVALRRTGQAAALDALGAVVSTLTWGLARWPRREARLPLGHCATDHGTRRATNLAKPARFRCLWGLALLMHRG